MDDSQDFQSRMDSLNERLTKLNRENEMTRLQTEISFMERQLRELDISHARGSGVTMRDPSKHLLEHDIKTYELTYPRHARSRDTHDKKFKQFMLDISHDAPMHIKPGQKTLSDKGLMTEPWCSSVFYVIQFCMCLCIRS